jgi:OHCU decarboxylase|tara:strand:- start:644 stop:1138 length:495 start_codon:yes stop_codon:yes gene_type:complete
MQLIKDINLLTKKEFLSIFGNIFEKSDWIAISTFELKPFKDIKDFKDKMMNIYEKSSKEKIIIIFNLHPKLAVEKKLTSFSSKEQFEAKLNTCTKEEMIEFRNLNEHYHEKFGFPFIMAVKGKSKNEILDSFRQRVKNNFEVEFNEAKLQVKKIASLRLNEILN